MSSSPHAFDPELSRLFTEQYKDNIDSTSVDGQWLFYQLNQKASNQFIMPMAYNFVVHALKNAEKIHSSVLIREYSVEALSSLQVSKIDALTKSYMTQENSIEYIRQITALQLTEACWLENTFQISCSQTVIATQLMSIYLQLTQKQKKRGLYQSLQLGERKEKHRPKTGITPAIFDFSSIQLALGQLPRVFFPEILGFTLAYCQMSTLTESCCPDHQTLEKQVKPVTKCISEYLDLFPAQQKVLWHRVQHGFWLYQMQRQHCRDHFNRKVRAEPSSQQTINFQQHEPKINYTKLSTRELYYYLINADLFPDVLVISQNKLDKWLKLSTLFNPLPFKQYSHQQFDAYIEGIYQTETSAYQPLQGKPRISKTAYIWGIEQIAPMILIDGCWLQQSLTLQNTNPEICEILFSIYCDEVGNGQLQKNHCYIFQQLLDSLSIKVPPVHSKEFINHPSFINSAFDLPVYMLALSNFSDKFLPELLGLNMAIELSGLGKDYLRLVDEWNYWGIDSTIADIHISVDNYATGHTLLAKKAIWLYLDDILNRTGDTKILNSHWRRVFTGYTSLRFFGGRFKHYLPVYYLINKLRSRLTG